MKQAGAKGIEYPCRICNEAEAFGRRYVETDEKRKEFDICLTCAGKERDRLRVDLEAILSAEQKELYEKYQKADEHFTSIIILD